MTAAHKQASAEAAHTIQCSKVVHIFGEKKLCNLCWHEKHKQFRKENTSRECLKLT